MLLSDLFPEFSLDTMPTFVIEASVDLLEEAGIRLDESQWQDAHISGMKYRVDPERPEMKQKRHVHVAAAKHVNAPTKQASWNDDGKRHDKKTFDSGLGAQMKYREFARRALGLKPTTVLEAIEPKRASQVATILESASESRSKTTVKTVIELHFLASRPLKKFSEFHKNG